MSRISPIDAVILERAYHRPQWLRTLENVRPRWKALCAAGFLEQCRPPEGTNNAKNMVRITDKGIDLIEAHWAAQKKAQRA